MANDWWARKLNATQSTQQNYVPEARYNHPQSYPQSMQPQPSAPTGPPRPETTGEGIRVWAGGAGTKTEAHACPNCGGDHYFSRKNAGVSGMAPAPYCHSCGFNGKFLQGDQSNWV